MLVRKNEIVSPTSTASLLIQIFRFVSLKPDDSYTFTTDDFTDEYRSVVLTPATVELDLGTRGMKVKDVPCASYALELDEK